MLFRYRGWKAACVARAADRAMWSCSVNRRAALLAVDRTANSEASAAAACFESAAAAHPGREAAAASGGCLVAAAKTSATAKTCGSPQKCPPGQQHC